jgi:alpha-glucoside transport system substrate-binding protein
MFPQPGKVNDFAEDIKPLTPEVVATVQQNFDEGWTDLVTVDGALKAIPAKADLKSLVWYCPSVFEENGYTVPTTQEEFTTLVDTMVEDGNTPICMGIGSDAATGWPMTDWIEDYMLRLKGPDVYDQWRKHEIAFNDPDVVEVGDYVVDLLSADGVVFGGFENVASTPFADAGLPMLQGDCMMHRQGNFYAANWPEGTELGPNGQVNAFYLPGSDENPNITLSGGIYAAAFADRPEVMATMNFIASTGFANGRAQQEIGGFLSPNKNVDTSLYPTELEQGFGQILSDADPVRFDASDLMPGEVGAGSFWTAVVDITTGTSVEDAFTEVEDSWPSS